MSSVVPRGLVILLALSTLSCGMSEAAAREKFEKEFSCPADRVQLKPRKDVLWASVSYTDTRGEPPAEVKADAQRLAKWNKDQDELYAPLIKLLNEHDVFEASGCDHRVYIGCKRPPKSNGFGNPFGCAVATLKTP